MSADANLFLKDYIVPHETILGLERLFMILQKNFFLIFRPDIKASSIYIFYSIFLL